MRSIDSIISRGRRSDMLFNVVGYACLIICLGFLAALLYNLLAAGVSRLSVDFFLNFPSRRAAQAGILSSWVGSLLIMVVTAAMAIPLGVAAGVYLEEYGRKNWFTSLIEINIANLAGVPSIIYGLMALGMLVYQFGWGHSVMTGGATLAFLILPIVIVATREALRSIPQNMREAAFALGATRWQVVRQHLLPYSLGGISTGVIIALSRAIGETAPLVTIGALTYIAFLPPAPLAPKPWLTWTTATVSVPETSRDMPVLGLGDSVFLTRPPREGAFEILVREGPGRSAGEGTPHRVVLTPQTTLESLRAAIDASPGLQAFLTEGGNLSIRAEGEGEFRIVDDDAGFARSFGVQPGGGRRGLTEWVWSPFTVLPIQMFNWSSRPDAAFAANAAAAGLVLMVVTLGMNTVAIVVRARMRRRIKW